MKIAMILALLLANVNPTLAISKVRGVKPANGTPVRFLKDDESSKDDSNDDGDEHDKGPKKRDCKSEISEDEYKFKCKSKVEDETQEIKDEIEFKVKRKDNRGIVVKIAYEQEIEFENPDTDGDDDDDDDDDNSAEETAVALDAAEDPEEDDGDERRALNVVEETETETSYELVCSEVIEYKYSTAGAGYDWSDPDSVVTRLDLSSWGEFMTLTAGTEDEITTSFLVTSMDERATFTFTVTRASEGESVNANTMKIDFRLVDFPWSDESNTYVALLCAVETEKKTEVEYEDDTEDTVEDIAIDFGGATDQLGIVPFGKLTWATEAYVLDDVNATNEDVMHLWQNGTDISVVASTGSNVDGVEEIAFAFTGNVAEKSNDLYWDPSAGVSYATAENDPFRDTRSAAYANFGVASIGLMTTAAASILALVM